MRVILLEDVKKQGKKGDIITVKDGYGSYLINNHLAILETKTSKKVLEQEILQTHLEEQEALKQSKELKKQIEKIILTFKVKTGTNDQVFGSISTKQISSELQKHGINIDKRKIKLDIPINTLGITEVTIELHKQVEAKIKVHLTK